MIAATVFAVQFGLVGFSSSTRAACSSPGEPTVVTDKADYAPAETVIIDGCSFGAWEGQTLTLNITRPNGIVDTTTVTVTAGNFTYGYLLDGILGIYYINVLDSGSNVLAATTFTDHTSGIVLVRDNDDAFFADSYTTDAFGVTMDISWTGAPDVTQIRLLNDPTPENACPAFVAEPWLPVTEIGVSNTAVFPWTVTGDTVSGLRKVCAQTAYGTLGSPSGILSHEDTIFFRRPNPTLVQTCGIDVVVVMDNSGSVDAGELASMQAAINGIVTALMPETPTEMALVTFNTSATLVQPFTASEATMSGAVTGVPATGNFTNWDDGIANGRALLPNRAGYSDLIIVASDGHPNRRGGHTGLSHTAGVSGAITESAAMGWAIAEANQAKLDGARIIGIGEGGDLSVNNMIGISATSVRTPAPASMSVDVWTTDFASLASTLATFAGEACTATVNVHKTIDADGNLGTTGDQTPGATWTFNCNAAPDTCTPPSGDTNGAGDVAFEIDTGGDSSASVDVIEPGEPGFGFVSASCTKNALPIGTPGAGQVTGIAVVPADVVDCTFYNTPAAYLTVNKACAPPADAGLFNLLIDATTYGTDTPCGGSTGPVLLSAGPHTVSETAGTGTSLANYDSVISGDCAANGSITLAAGENKTCTITNTRKATLTVNKVCVPPADPGLFNLKIDGTTYGADKPCGGSTGPVPLNAGPHTVSETAGTGTILANYASLIGGDCAANGTVTLGSGESKTCTITNERLGTIVITKVAVPQTPQDFDYNCTFLGPFQLDDDGANGNPLDNSKTFYGVAPGNYDCAESQVSGWMMQIACTDPDNGTTIGPPTAHIDVDGGETVECVFTNTFVPGESQAVGGIVGLIDAPNGAPPAAGLQPSGNGAGWWAAIALMAAAVAAITGLTAGVRRLARIARRA